MSKNTVAEAVRRGQEALVSSPPNYLPKRRKDEYPGRKHCGILMTLGTLCYVRRSDKTLMLHRVKKKHDIHQGKWNGLGGKLESGETPEECVIREVQEESGLTIADPSLKGILTFPAFGGIENWIVFVFEAHQFEGKLQESDEGILKWVDRTELFNLNLWEGDRIFLKWIEEGRFFSGKFIYKEDRLVHHHVVFY